MENDISLKMKILLILITLHGTQCTSLQFPDLKLQRYHVPIVDIMNVNQSILYYKGNDNDMLINFILKRVFNSQAVLLATGDKITDLVNNKYRNVILFAETLNTEDFETAAFKTLLCSNWCPLYLVITTRSKNYTCVNGTLNENAFAETKDYLNVLWQKFRIVRVIVSFPYTCPKHYVIYDGKESSDTDVYNRSIRLIRPKNKQEYTSALAYSGDHHNLAKDYPLRANIFYRFPTSISECDVVSQYTNINFEVNNQFCGLDGLVMHDYVDHYKFNLSVVKNGSCDKYGFVDTGHNKTITGSLGCIVRGQIDISFNSRFIWQYTKERYFYLNYISQDSLCAVLKRTGQVPLWHYAGNMFTPPIWIALLSCLSFVGIVTWLAAKLRAKFSHDRPRRLHTYLINAIHSALFGVLLNNDGRFLILKGTCLLSSIILLAVYQGHFNYQFTTRSHYYEIKTLEHLYKSTFVLSISQSIMELMKPSMDLNNEYQAAFVERAQIRNSTPLEFLLEHADAATMLRQKDVTVEVLQNYTDQYGFPKIYVIDECFKIFYLSYIARNGFLFLEQTQKFMMRLTEAGLPYKYYIWTRNTFNLADHWPEGPTPRQFKKIQLKKLRIAFGILLLGYLVSGLVFIVEWCKRRKPGNKVRCIISR